MILPSERPVETPPVRPIDSALSGVGATRKTGSPVPTYNVTELFWIGVLPAIPSVHAIVVRNWTWALVIAALVVTALVYAHARGASAPIRIATLVFFVATILVVALLHVSSTVIAIPNYRLKITADTQFAWSERPAGRPPALPASFYRGDNLGQEISFPKRQAETIAAAVREPLSLVDEEELVMTAQVDPEKPAPQEMNADQQPGSSEASKAKRSCTVDYVTSLCVPNIDVSRFGFRPKDGAQFNINWPGPPRRPIRWSDVKMYLPVLKLREPSPSNTEYHLRVMQDRKWWFDRELGYIKVVIRYGRTEPLDEDIFGPSGNGTAPSGAPTWYRGGFYLGCTKRGNVKGNVAHAGRSANVYVQWLYTYEHCLYEDPVWHDAIESPRHSVSCR